MKFPAFEYSRPETLEEAIALLAADEDAKVIAGGQSLLPLMALRLARPSRLVDLQGIALESVQIEPGDEAATGPEGSAGGSSGVLRLGAMTRQARLWSEPVVRAGAPLLAEAVAHVGHQATRNLGTFGGSLAHADPAAEMPTVAVVLRADVVVEGPAGRRTVSCADLAEGYFTTCLQPGEVITEIRVPVAGGQHGAAWCEWAPRAGDFADAGIGVVVEGTGGSCTQMAAAACGVASVPLDLSDALAGLLVGASNADADLLRSVAARVRQETVAAGDDKAEMTGLLAARAVARAFERMERRAEEVRV